MATHGTSAASKPWPCSGESWPHSEQRARCHLLRIFRRFLNLYRISPCPDNDRVSPRCRSAALEPDQEVFMGKLALCLLGFLALAIGVGLLGTISPY
ncbi:hypothetical protein EGJ27_03000 [Pseudomonas sp. v388]|nr:hypothetical protein EGJ27_03000 [Pseudomonas sp. v388]